MERDKIGPDFSQERDVLYNDCGEFVEELIEDKGKPWYPVKSRVEWILEKIPYVRDIKELKEYERKLREAKAEVERTKEETGDEGFEYAYASIVRWLRDRERKQDEEGVDERLRFYRMLDTLYKDCEMFIEELMQDVGKPWYPVKSRAEWILEKIPHALDIKRLEEYEFELKAAKAEVERTKEEMEADGFEFAYERILKWLRDMERSTESKERKIDDKMLLFYQKLDILYNECELFIEELMDDMGESWYYSAKKAAERIFEKIPHALGMKELEKYEKELNNVKEQVKRKKDR